MARVLQLVTTIITLAGETDIIGIDTVEALPHTIDVGVDERNITETTLVKETVVTMITIEAVREVTAEAAKGGETVVDVIEKRGPVEIDLETGIDMKNLEKD
mmetsp:Transcript_6907/g.14001  ORF Transcript_6907/g.14001 Transcript_6907/m.14001 type:complete len:102 (+) Transcript_6907:944-1249(+)